MLSFWVCSLQCDKFYTTLVFATEQIAAFRFLELLESVRDPAESEVTRVTVDGIATLLLLPELIICLVFWCIGVKRVHGSRYDLPIFILTLTKYFPYIKPSTEELFVYRGNSKAVP